MFSFIKKLFLHIITSFIIFLNIILKPSINYFLISFISVIVIIIFQVSTDLTIDSIDKLTDSLLKNLRDTSILSTILSTIVCFLVGLYFLVEKPAKNTIFVTLSWILVVITIFLFTITLVEIYKNSIIFNTLIKYYFTYFLLVSSFILTVYAKVDWKNIKKTYNMQYVAIDSKFMNKSEFNGKNIKL